MSGHRCFTGDELLAILDAPPGDPRRREAEACPRCAAECIAHARFLEGGPAAEGADLADARRRLGAFVAREIIGEPGGAVADRAARARRPGRWWQAVPRPAWALAVVIGGLAITLVRLQPWREDPIVLRGATKPGEEAAALIKVLPATALRDGGVLLRWQPVAGAEGYEVSLLTAGLEPVLSRRTARDTTLQLDPASLRAAAGAEQVLYWTVAVERGGRAVGHSAPQPLPLR